MKKQNYATRLWTAYEKDLIHQTMKPREHYNGKNKKAIGLLKEELSAKIMKEIVVLNPRCTATSRIMTILNRKQMTERII